MYGTVTRYLTDRGFGFIRGEDGNITIIPDWTRNNNS